MRSATGSRSWDTIEALDVSGATPLEQRHGLRRAVEMIEASQAEVVVAAYFDRLVRALVVQGRGSGAGVLCLPCLV